jgi:ABC-2 type transport system permease protein
VTSTSHATTTHATTTGAVYDRGYRPYDGPRGGRGAARLALFRVSLRRALGLRRPWRQKVAPFLLLGVAVIPAVVNVGIGYVTRDSPPLDFEFITYRDYVVVSSSLFLLFVALTGPDVLCPDRRNRMLPLVFARPLTGADYVVAKLGAITAIVFAFGVIPQIVLFGGQMLVRDHALDYLRDNAEVLWQVPAAVAIVAVYYSAIVLAISSLTGRRIVAAAVFIGLMFASATVSAILVGDPSALGRDGSVAGLIDLAGLPLHLRDLLFLGHVDPEGPLAGVATGGLLAGLTYAAVLTVAAVVLFARYRWEDR